MSIVCSSSRGKFLKDKDVSFLRNLIKEHYGTDDFRDFKVGSDLYKKAQSGDLYEKAAAKVGKTYKSYLLKIFGKIK